MVCHQGGKILQGVQRLSAMADNKSNVLSIQSESSACFLLLNFYRHIGKSHFPEYVFQIVCGLLSRIVFLNIGPHLCWTAAKKSKRLFCRHFQNFKFCVCRLHAQLSAGICKSNFYGLACGNGFSNHGFTFPFSCKAENSIPFFTFCFQDSQSYCWKIHRISYRTSFVPASACSLLAAAPAPLPRSRLQFPSVPAQAAASPTSPQVPASPPAALHS